LFACARASRNRRASTALAWMRCPCARSRRVCCGLPRRMPSKPRGHKRPKMAPRKISTSTASWVDSGVLTTPQPEPRYIHRGHVNQADAGSKMTIWVSWAYGHQIMRIRIRRQAPQLGSGPGSAPDSLQNRPEKAGTGAARSAAIGARPPRPSAELTLAPQVSPKNVTCDSALPTLLRPARPLYGPIGTLQYKTQMKRK
jgi:hypothetical protein